jgi:hypothetical protein
MEDQTGVAPAYNGVDALLVTEPWPPYYLYSSTIKFELKIDLEN